MFCGKCGKQIEDHAKFCPYCGAETGIKIERKNPKKEQPQELEKVAEEPVKVHKSKRRAGIVAVGIVCVCAIAGGALFFGKSGLTEKKAGNKVTEAETTLEEANVESSAGEESEESVAETTALAAEVESTETETEVPETEVLAETEEFNTHMCGTLEDDYILPDCATRYYTSDEIRSITPDELYIARNEIYARHGRAFKNEKLMEYFSSKSWYHPIYTPEEFDAMGDSVFNEYELANRAVLLELEKVVGE